MTTDISEKGLETIIMRHMTGTDGLAVTPGAVAENPEPDGTGYFAGSPKDYDRTQALDVPQLFAFLRATQPEAFKKLTMGDASDPRDINRLKFLARLSADIGKRGVVDVLRKGIDHHPAGHFDLFYGTPSEGNARAQALHAKNRFSMTRQLAYSTDEMRRALDLCLFINGLPIATFELKNSLTKQTVEDAVEQYKRNRDPRERLFGFGRWWMCGPTVRASDTWCSTRREGSPHSKGFAAPADHLLLGILHPDCPGLRPGLVGPIGPGTQNKDLWRLAGM